MVSLLLSTLLLTVIYHHQRITFCFFISWPCVLYFMYSTTPHSITFPVILTTTSYTHLYFSVNPVLSALSIYLHLWYPVPSWELSQLGGHGRSISCLLIQAHSQCSPWPANPLSIQFSSTLLIHFTAGLPVTPSLIPVLILSLLNFILFHYHWLSIPSLYCDSPIQPLHSQCP